MPRDQKSRTLQDHNREVYPRIKLETLIRSISLHSLRDQTSFLAHEHRVVLSTLVTASLTLFPSEPHSLAVLLQPSFVHTCSLFHSTRHYFSPSFFGASRHTRATITSSSSAFDPVFDRAPDEPRLSRCSYLPPSSGHCCWSTLMRSDAGTVTTILNVPVTR
jgi:hypothetical protein